jgi:hypothetical protein
MASPRQFQRNMKQRGRNVEDNADQLVRKAALAIDAVLVLATPVDTGRARANWQVELNRPAEGTTTSVSPSGREALEQGKSTIAGYRGGTPDAAVHITNNLPYIGKLNDGHSAQAPAGFVEEAVITGASTVRGAKLLGRTTSDD